MQSLQSISTTAPGKHDRAVEQRTTERCHVYHPNVQKSISTHFALICPGKIPNAERRATSQAWSGDSDCVLSTLTPQQMSIIKTSVTPQPGSIPTIETVGGSVLCRIAGIHLPADRSV